MQGVQTFITTNHDGPRPNDSALNKESWGFYPDAKPIRSFYSGDPRAAIAPFQAHRSAHPFDVPYMLHVEALLSWSKSQDKWCSDEHGVQRVRLSGYAL